MRRRSWAVLGLLVAGGGLAVIANSTQASGLFVVAGGCLLLAGVLGVSLLPFWGRLLRAGPDLGPLFPVIGPRARWCVHCGRAAPRSGTCPSCGRGPRVKRRWFHAK